MAGSQDLVVMWDVIEHVKEPASLMKQIARVLRPDGYLAMTTGDIPPRGPGFMADAGF